MNVLILTGSHRRDSWTVQVAKDLHRLAPAGVSLEHYTGSETLPFYSQDLDVDDATVLPSTVTELRQAIHGVDALVVVTPEYNGSLPGVLKNAIDWASRPRGAASLDALPVAVVSVSPSPRGAEWAGSDVVKILTIAGADVIDAPLSVASVFQLMDAGRFIDAELAASLTSMLANLVSAVRDGAAERDAA